MVFNSYIFILCMLPLCMAGYFILNRFNTGAGKIFLIAWSFTCLGFYNISYSVLLAVSVLFNYFLSKLIIGTKGSTRYKITFVAIVSNIAALLYFKYINFAISNYNHVLGLSLSAIDIILPLGISFYTVQQISYIVDTYRGEITDVCAVDYFLYVTFFPQLVQGPIILHDEIIPQFNDQKRKTADYDNIASGIMLFVVGLFKKVIVADSLGKIVNWGMGGELFLNLSSLEIIAVMFSYSFQLYFDFSGYCDMAAGIGRMLNFDFPINFNSPYKAVTISDFWDRWHITLTKFLTKYVYFPLGGSRKGGKRTLLNIMLVFLISGLWHGANWTFILWGCLHGVGQVIERIINKKPNKLWLKTLAWTVTFSFVSVLWLLFRSATIYQWLSMLKGVFVNSSIGFSTAFYIVFKDAIIDLIGFEFFVIRTWMIWLLLIACLIICVGFQNSTVRKFQPNYINLIITIVMFLYCFMSLDGASTFLYFDF